MATKKDILLDHFKKHGSITNIELMQLVSTTCPHSVIRSIRRQYGYDCIENEQHYKPTRYDRYIWRRDEKADNE